MVENTQVAREKIFCLCTRFATGGAEMNAYLVASELHKRGHDTCAVYMLNRSDLTLPDKNRYRVLCGFSRPTYIAIIVAAAKFLALAIKERPSVIIGFHPLGNILGALAAKCVGARAVATQRNPSSSQRLVTRWLDKLIGCTSFYSANIAVSHAVQDTYAHYPANYRNKMVVIHNGIDAPPNDVIDRHQARQILGLSHDSFIVGSIGRLSYQKNQEFLLQLLVEAESQEFILVLAGEGETRDFLYDAAVQLEVLDRVIFLGNLTGEHVTAFYAAVDVFVLPSRYEGFGRTLVEALHFNLPILANDLPVTREVLGDAAFLEPLCAVRWLNRIRSIARGEHAQLLSTPRVKAEEYSVDTMINGYEQVSLARDE